MVFDAMPFDAIPSADRPAWLTLPCVRVVPAVDVPGLPKLFSNEEARQFLRMGVNKFARVKKEIDVIEIADRQLYTLDALLAYVTRKTRKAGARPAPAAVERPPPKSAAAGNKVTPLRRPKRGESRATT